MKRVKVVLSSVVTWAAVVTGIASAIVARPEMFPDNVVAGAAVVVAVGSAVASIVVAIRRVTPVPASERGLLPPA